MYIAYSSAVYMVVLSGRRALNVVCGGLCEVISTAAAAVMCSFLAPSVYMMCLGESWCV